MSRWPSFALFIALAYGPWLLADALYVRSGQSDSHWAASSGLLTGAAYWALIVPVIGIAWLSFQRFAHRSTGLAIGVAILAIATFGLVVAYLTYAGFIFFQTVVFGGKI